MSFLCSRNFSEILESTKVDPIHKKIKRTKTIKNLWIFYLISQRYMKGASRNKQMITLYIFYANFNVGFCKFLVHNNVCWFWLKNLQRRYFAAVTRFAAKLYKNPMLGQLLVISWLYFIEFQRVNKYTFRFQLKSKLKINWNKASEFLSLTQKFLI